MTRNTCNYSNENCWLDCKVQPYSVLLFFFFLGYTGFRWDRQWLVVNYKGRAYTQRVEPKLSLVQVELPDEAFIEGWEPSKSSYLGKKH